MAGEMWRAYADGLEPRHRAFVEQEALIQLGGLMLTRVDGKSKVEYLVGTEGAGQALAFGRSLLRERPGSIDQVLRRYG